MELFDVLIVGGGPIGLACALEARKNNLKYIVIEKGTVANSLYDEETARFVAAAREDITALIGEIGTLKNEMTCSMYLFAYGDRKRYCCKQHLQLSFIHDFFFNGRPLGN